jgi:Ni,Fe-hydrogenase I small subunit
VAISIIVSAAALLTLGFCSSSGGVSSAYGDYSKVSGIDSDIKDGYGAMQAGFGKFFFRNK